MENTVVIDTYALLAMVLNQLSEKAHRIFKAIRREAELRKAIEIGIRPSSLFVENM